MQTSQGIGMQTMDMAIAELLEQGKITRETAIEKAATPDLFKEEDDY